VKARILVHAALVVVAAGAATFVWTRDKQPKALAEANVTVWSGRAADVERVTFEAKTHKLALDAKKDDRGRYFIGVEEKEAAKPFAPDAGADATPTPAPERTTTTFVSVGGAEKLAEALAPLKALRAIGKIGDDRAAEFGLSEPEGTLVVRVGSTEHKLVIGGATPGGSDRYARDPGSGEVFVLRGDVFRDVDAPDARLLERELHEWKEADVRKARISAGGKARDVARGGTEQKRFWADSGSPDQNDETVGNWMAKLDRLRPSEYLATAPASKELVVRVEYAGTSPLGWLEVVKTPGATGKPDYLVQTERTRLYGKISQTLAEQVEQDVGSIVR
jgi:hypothetical protein